ncbi:MAG: PIN domain-containing protein [Verrucomicrobia bacterium]|jgi:predicted nucleic acid-binding protein|nr:PIN domain-containing protein [Verrucomicrobiota bacterium]
MKYLLDTSVCSQPIKKRPVLKVLQRWDAQCLDALATSAACLAEIEWGLHKLGSERRWLGYRRDILPSVRALPVDSMVWSKWAVLKARQDALGLRVDDIDLVIAATAVNHDLIVATLNVRHFAQIEGLRWEDWSR